MSLFFGALAGFSFARTIDFAVRNDNWTFLLSFLLFVVSLTLSIYTFPNC